MALLLAAERKFTVGVSGVVLDESGSVLLLKHTFRRRYPWGCSAGWVKGTSRSKVRCAARRWEETGLSISVDRLIAVRKDRYGLFLEAVYACHVGGGTSGRATRSARCAGCAVDALPEETHPNHAPLILG